MEGPKSYRVGDEVSPGLKITKIKSGAEEIVVGEEEPAEATESAETPGIEAERDDAPGETDETISIGKAPELPSKRAVEAWGDTAEVHDGDKEEEPAAAAETAEVEPVAEQKTPAEVRQELYEKLTEADTAAEIGRQVAELQVSVQQELGVDGITSNSTEWEGFARAVNRTLSTDAEDKGMVTAKMNLIRTAEALTGEKSLEFNVAVGIPEGEMVAANDEKLPENVEVLNTGQPDEQVPTVQIQTGGIQTPEAANSSEAREYDSLDRISDLVRETIIDRGIHAESIINESRRQIYLNEKEGFAGWFQRGPLRRLYQNLHSADVRIEEAKQMIEQNNVAEVVLQEYEQALKDSKWRESYAQSELRRKGVEIAEEDRVQMDPEAEKRVQETMVLLKRFILSSPFVSGATSSDMTIGSDAAQTFWQERYAKFKETAKGTNIRVWAETIEDDVKDGITSKKAAKGADQLFPLENLRRDEDGAVILQGVVEEPDGEPRQAA